MIRKSLTLLCLAIAAIVSAQNSVGDWQIYPMFNSSIDNMVDTPDKLYYTSAGTLYSYDHSNDESYVFSTRNKLSDSKITRINYNPNEGFLLISYANGNFDMLYDDGHVVNLPELKDNNNIIDKTVNYVSFGDGRIYVATNFGIIVYDSKKHQVVESGIFNTDIKLIGEINDHIVLFAEKAFWAAPKNMRHNALDKFENYGPFWATDWRTVSDNEIIFVNTDLYKATVNFDGKSISWATLGLGTVANGIGDTTDGYFASTSDNKIHLINAAGQKTATLSVPDVAKGNRNALWIGADRVWFGDGSGICSFDLTGQTPTLTMDRYKPNAFSCESPALACRSVDGKSIFFTNLGPSAVYTCANGDGDNYIQTTNRIEGDKITDVSIKNAWYREDKDWYINCQNNNHTTGMIGGTSRMIPDPDIPDRYYVCNGYAGLFVVEGTTQIELWDRTNMPFNCGWRSRCYDVNIDPEGNLWVGHWNASGKVTYYMLPRAKRIGNPLDVKFEDWVATKVYNGYSGGKDMVSVFCTKGTSGKKIGVFIDSNWGGQLLMYDAGQSWSDTSDDKSSAFNSELRDQDGNSFSPTNYICAVEDNKGRVWVGTTLGIFEITNPAAALNGHPMDIRRPKVPRNDGTNFADFLLETDKINCIAIDNSNRKWVATEVSGVYLVSEDGDQILANYNTTNSYLPSNTVYSVICDPLTNRVFFGTAVGVVSFNGTSAPASEDFSNVYAYPNPVRPDFTGLITVTGLMNNSLVKIADSKGNVFYQGRSEGGMVTWDGCAPSGERVRSGVYYVYASQNADGSNSGVVTKILVIN